MEIVFVRHGEPDVTRCDETGFTGHSRNFAPLSPEGMRQARAAAAHPALLGSQIILSSPYTRALQTAAILSRTLCLPLQVEMMLHEFLPDTTFQVTSREELAALREDFIRCRGIPPPGESKVWESVASIAARTKSVLEQYLHFRKIIVVAHGGVIRRYTGQAEVTYCMPYCVQFNRGFICYGWV